MPPPGRTRLQLCRPLSGAVRCSALHGGRAEGSFNCAAPFRGRLAGHSPAATRCLSASFNCAAPFRGRLVTRCLARQSTGAVLQLCRPLSGAVSAIAVYRNRIPMCFNCAAPFRGRLGAGPGEVPAVEGSFNCAAPFRGRLGRSPVVPGRAVGALQLCRPYIGRYEVRLRRVPGAQSERFNCAAPFRGRLAGRRRECGAHPQGFNCAARMRIPPQTSPPRRMCGASPGLQLCRPLSGAVSSRCRKISNAASIGASIVPPPFGGG